ncbi:hypothetical protein OICFNHDK_0096 [Methylobacterium bullatum]|uniref:Uncharacterized protein n=1 Tax=Methylobacterium bullatum TaxID=570505 RepID=A0A679K3A8_9HYPH|nr:hypothetical protein OICFNHDK_0096 [Methylobacterium bullatum]CAA2138581.1 hypothetical protein MBLL_01217 [Methylobacterium bullatum]
MMIEAMIDIRWMAAEKKSCRQGTGPSGRSYEDSLDGSRSPRA